MAGYCREETEREDTRVRKKKNIGKNGKYQTKQKENKENNRETSRIVDKTSRFYQKNQNQRIKGAYLGKEIFEEKKESQETRENWMNMNRNCIHSIKNLQ